MDRYERAAAGIPLRLLITDRRPLAVLGMASLAESAGYLVAARCHGRESLSRALYEHEVDLVVIELEVYDGQAELAVAEVRLVRPRALILFSATRVVDTLLAVLAVSGVSCFAGDCDGASFLLAVRSLVQGRPVIPHEVQRALAQRFVHRGRAGCGLTGREEEILALLAVGLEVKQIALRLRLSQSTIKTHLQHIYEKLDVPNRATAVAKAIRSGILTEQLALGSTRGSPGSRGIGAHPLRRITDLPERRAGIGLGQGPVAELVVSDAPHAGRTLVAAPV